jgi:lipoate-protein ligase A
MVTVSLHNQVSVQVVGGLVRSSGGGAVVASGGKLTLMMMVARPTIELEVEERGGERR